MLRNTVVSLAMSVAMLAGLGAYPAFAEVLNLYTGNASKNTAVGKLEEIAAAIKERTDGEVEIKIHLGGSLQIQVSDMALAVGDGVVQLGDDQVFASAVPVSGILRLPGLIRSREDYEKANAIVQPHVEKQYAKYNVKLLGTYYYPPLELFSAGRSIKSLDDIKGMKIRTLSAESSLWVEEFGGVPLTITFAELAPALDNGTVEGLLTAAVGAGYPLRDQIKHLFRVPIGFSQVYEIMNLDSYEGLSSENRAAVEEEFQKGLGGLTDTIFSSNVELTKKMAGDGMGLVEATPEELETSEKAMVKVWDKWAEDHGPEEAEVLKEVRQALDR